MDKISKDDLHYWDNEGESIDRYTVVFPDGSYIIMDDQPFWPLGFCQHGTGAEFEPECDKKNGELYSYLGKKIYFEDLSKDCKKVVRNDIKSWNN